MAGESGPAENPKGDARRGPGIASLVWLFFYSMLTVVGAGLIWLVLTPIKKIMSLFRGKKSAALTPADPVSTDGVEEPPVNHDVWLDENAPHPKLEDEAENRKPASEGVKDQADKKKDPQNK